VTFVVDASVSLAWCFVDESTPGTQALLDRAVDEGTVVPSIWPFEMANILALALRRGRIDAVDLGAAITSLGRLEITVDVTATQRALSEILDLAAREKLTSYDAAYLDLAMREGLPLATRDSKLAAAARRASVEVLEG
jgi:predicted nucleic acid-binding protein